MCCDKCKYYIWYWDKCTKWDCILDAREVHNCFEPISTPIYDYMVGKAADRKERCMSDIITVTMGALQTEFDNEVVRAVQNVGIYVDKEKLIEALQLAESLVRCKDCKYKRLYDEGETKYYYCALEDRPNRNWSVDDTDYCSWGERREDGE